MTTFDAELGFVSESGTQVAELQFQLATLQESWDEAAAALLRLRTEDEGWKIMGQVNSTDGFSMDVLKRIAEKAEIQSTGNPLLKAAFDLRFNPIFSRGFHLEGDVKPRYQRKLDNPTVQEVLFSDDGLDALERTCYNAGNLFVAYNRLTGDMLRIPFAEITNRAVDPDFPARTAYYQWSRTRTLFDGRTEQLIEWIPVVEWTAAGKDSVDEIAQHPVNHDWTVIDQRVNVPSTGHWGVPDVFPALPYAWGYSEYIRDASSLLKAMTTIAWKVIGKSKSQAQAAGVALAGSRKTGGVAAMTSGTTIESMPKSGQVDMSEGRAIAALVASATGVSTNALLSMAEGSSAAVQSLDGPTVAMARARQKRWVNFYRRVFLAMGIEDVTINFAKITEDPIHRQVSSLATLRATGALWSDEYRKASLEAMSISPLHDSAPDVEEYAQSQNALGFLKWVEEQEARIEGENDPLARQGNSGVAGTLGEIDNTNRNLDTQAGSGTQTDLVG